MSKITINNIKLDFGYENNKKEPLMENHKKTTRYNKK